MLKFYSFGIHISKDDRHLSEDISIHNGPQKDSQTYKSYLKRTNS